MTAARRFDVALRLGFEHDLGTAPKKVRHAFTNWVYDELRSRPDTEDPPRVLRLKGFKDLWRVRISDEYRLVYHLDRGARVVTMLLLDHRNKIYERVGA